MLQRLDDYAVARTVHAAHLLEKACHDGGQWQIVVGTEVLAAERKVTRDSILIEAQFSARCWVTNPHAVAELLCDGSTLSVKPIRVPDDEVPFTIRWSFSVVQPTVASVLAS